MTNSGHRRKRGDDFDTDDDRFRLLDGGRDAPFGDLDDTRDTDDPDHVDEVDELLRNEFNRTFPVAQESDRVLEEIRPTFVRARRRHRAKQAVASVAVGVTATAAGLLAFTQFTDSGARLETAPATVGDSEQTQVEMPTTLGLPATSASDATLRTTTAGEGNTTSEQATSEPSTPTAPTSTPAPTSTTTSATPTSTPSEETIESPCGSVVVSVVGSNVEFVEALPQPRFDVDVKSTGRKEVEVSFEGVGSHCEIKVEWRDGELRTEIENE